MRYSGDLLEIESYEIKPEDIPVVQEITEYIENKYSVKVHKCIFDRDEQGTIWMIFVYIFTNRDFKKIDIKNYHLKEYREVVERVVKIFEKHGFTDKDIQLKGYGVLLKQFEYYAVQGYYSQALEEIRELAKRTFNPETMVRNQLGSSKVVYKTEEFLQEAIENGDKERFKKELYEILKKYDKYGFITPQKHVSVWFYTPQTLPDYRQFSPFLQNAGEE